MLQRGLKMKQLHQSPESANQLVLISFTWAPTHTLPTGLWALFKPKVPAW